MIHQSIKVTVDAVVVGYDESNSISVLLIQRKNEPFQGNWALPGGFVEDDESLEAAALRELEEETSLMLPTLDQVYTFGMPGRDPRGRTISVAYVGVVRKDAQIIKAKSDADKVGWFKITKLPKMAFDHRDILATALRKLRENPVVAVIGLELLNSHFSFSELVTLYEAMLGRPVNKNLLKKFMLKSGVVKEVTSRKNLLSTRSQKVYQFDRKRCQKLKKSDSLLLDFLPF